MDGARGPLSRQQTQAILDKLKASGQETSIFDRHLALEEGIVGTPLTVGNKVVLLQNGAATYSAMFAAIARATDHINMESYIFEDDEIGQKFADALLARQARGVQVTLIYDSVRSNGSTKEFFKGLTDAGVQVLEFNPINPLAGNKHWQVANRDHRELLIVDGKTALVGGVNIGGVYSSGSDALRSKGQAGGSALWRDTHLQVQGPVVADFQKVFMTTWEPQKGAPMKPRNFFPAATNSGGEVVRAIGSSPDDAYSLIYATLVSAIDSAETSVRITNAYFVPDPQLLTALVDAAARGVDVRLVLPSNTDNWMVFNAGRSHYEHLLASGVKIYERGGPEGTAGEIPAAVGHPFAPTAAALKDPQHWCEILMLHLDTKECRLLVDGAGVSLAVGVVSKYDQPASAAYRASFIYSLVEDTPEALRVRLDAEKGPVGTSNYRILLEAASMDEAHTSIHMSYSYS